MLERRCNICGCQIIIEGSNVTITKSPTHQCSNVTCVECKKFIRENIGGT